MSLTAVAGTRVCGTVLAAEQVGGADVELAGATISVDGAEDTMNAETAADGTFCLDPAPAGEFFVHIDGRTVDNPLPPGAYYPFVGKLWSSIPGEETSIGNVYLPLVPADSLQPTSPTQDTPVQLPASLLAGRPQLAGVKVTVPADALYSEDGSRGGKVGLALVPPDRLPGPLPPGADPPVVITVQSDLGTNFDEPAPACFPNLASGSAAPPAPGAKTALVSFDHDVGDWVVAGSMTVSADGTLVCTDPGVGIREPGWHFVLAIGEAIMGAIAGSERLAEGTFLELTAQGMRLFPGEPKFARDQLDKFLNGDQPANCRATGYASPDCQARFSSGSDVATAMFDHPRFKQQARDRTELELKLRVAQARASGQTVADFEYKVPNGVSFYEGHPTQFWGGVGWGAVKAQVSDVTYDPETGNYSADVRYVLEDEYSFHNDAGLSPWDNAAFDLENFGEAKAFKTIIEQDSIVNDSVGPNPNLGGDPPSDGEGDPRLPFLTSGFSVSYELEGDRVLAVGPDGSGGIGTLVDHAADGYWHRIADAESGLVVSRGPGTGPSFRLAGDREFLVDVLRATDLAIGRLKVEGPPPGGHVLLPVPLLEAPDPVDADADGAPDAAEAIVGTQPDDPDSDDDGIEDGAEIRNGTDPLDGRPVRTGVIGATSLPGNAVDVEAFGDLAAVAVGTAGVVLLDASNRSAPVRVAQINTPGTAQSVAMEGDRLLVADGDGVVVVDVSDPSEPELIAETPLGAGARRVAAAAGVGYVGLDGRNVAVVDLRSGAELDRILLPDDVHNVAVAGGELYVVTDSALHVFRDVAGGLEELGSTALPLASTTFELRSLFVGGGLAHVGLPTGASPGYRTVDVSDPENPVLVGQPSTPQPAIHGIAANGSGLVIASTRFANLPRRNLSLFDASDPTETGALLTSFTTAGDATGVSVFGGLAYVADGTGGLQVVNYRAYDGLGVPPTVTVGAPATTEEHKFVLLAAQVTDDVQVREVEFLVDGEVVARDGSFPFEHRLRVGAAPDSLTVRARAVDTGGNAAFSGEATIGVTEDATPPLVARVSPAGRSLPPGRRLTVAAAFREPLDPATLTAARLRVFAPDNQVLAGTLEYRDGTNTALLALNDPLTQIGEYRIVVGPGIADLAGNAMPAAVERTFRVSEADIGPGEKVGFSGSIDAGGAEDVHAIKVAPGQRLFFDTLVPDCSTFNGLRWTLRDPAGGVVFQRLMRFCDARGPVELAAAGGTYTLTIDGPSGATGAYSVEVWDVPDPDVGTLTVGTPIQGEIESPGREDRWTFTGTSGQRVFVDVTAAGGDCNQLTGLRAFLLRPDGSRLDDERLSFCTDNGPVALDATGTWTLAVHAREDDRATDTYALIVHDVPAPDVAPLTLGTPVQGAVESPGRQDRWTFTGTSGQRVFVDVTDVNANCNQLTGLRTHLVRPDGSERDSERMTFCDNMGPVELDASGTWTLTVHAADNDDDTGTYALVVHDVPPPDVAPLTLGTEVDGAIEIPGEQDRWTFARTTGQRIFVDVTDVNGNCNELTGLRTRVLRPDGSELTRQRMTFCDGRGPLTIDATGTWTLAVDALENDAATGTYSLIVHDVPPPDVAALTPGVPADGEIETPGRQDRWTFDATAGQVASFDVQAVGGDCSHSSRLQFSLSDPDGASVFANQTITFCIDRNGVPLGKTGTYRLDVDAPPDFDTAETYRFVLTLAAGGGLAARTGRDPGVDAVAPWIEAVAEQIGRRSLTPPRAARAFAVMSVALDDAVRGSRRPRAAAAAAGRSVMAELFGGVDAPAGTGGGARAGSRGDRRLGAHDARADPDRPGPLGPDAADVRLAERARRRRLDALERALRRRAHGRAAGPAGRRRAGPPDA